MAHLFVPNPSIEAARFTDQWLARNNFGPQHKSDGLFNNLAALGLNIVHAGVVTGDSRLDDLADSIKTRPPSTEYVKDADDIDAGLDLIGLALVLRKIAGGDVSELRPPADDIMPDIRGPYGLFIDGSAVVLSQRHPLPRNFSTESVDCARMRHQVTIDTFARTNDTKIKADLNDIGTFHRKTDGITWTHGRTTMDTFPYVIMRARRTAESLNRCGKN